MSFLILTRQIRGQTARMALVAVIFTSSLLSCGRGSDLDQSQLSSLAHESRLILGQYGSGTHIVPEASWTPAIRSIAPEQIYIRETGIYIVLNQWFVTESGFFVPRDEKVFTVSENSDPSYERIGPNIYWYEIRG